MSKNEVREQGRSAGLEMSPEEFRKAGHRLIDDVANFLATLRSRPVTTGEGPSAIRAHLGRHSLPIEGTDAQRLLGEASQLLFDHSLFNGHPRFLGYITSSAAPIGALADLLAAAVNPNVGAWNLSPVASEIERQTVAWIAELMGYPTDCGGLLVSGGNMANFVGFLVARHTRAPWPVRSEGMAARDARPLRLYASSETHTWIHKAADLFGLGTDAIRWIETDRDQRMDVGMLRQRIAEDKAAGHQPFLVVGTAGSVGVGAIDPLEEIADICREHDLWFHVDGAYGGVAALLPDAPADLKALAAADSVAIDPHKWLYAPLEAGCVLVRSAEALRGTFSYRPSYYKFDEVDGEEPMFFYEHGPQNSRGFRALKVWLGLRQAGRTGYERMLADDIELARELYRQAEADPELEACTHNLSITTFRYVPARLQPVREADEPYLNELNTALLTRLQEGGEAFVSNAVIGETYLLRACIVNFRTAAADIEALPGIVTRVGAAVDAELRAKPGA